MSKVDQTHITKKNYELKNPLNWCFPVSGKNYIKNYNHILTYFTILNFCKTIFSCYLTVSLLSDLLCYNKQ